ncbi:primosomal replication protein N [Jeongeupia sp. USM3]|uniref:primosomal replication protein N n=1 Tax=Jeongeupia sp. USM3 TaxID=1906741 RepID=UPI00089DE326|nr:primosomal replication protein N [Jeongeupia sp. USM3]AOX99188.1 primosomal replication protein N [Jeongeupia sp. USM3]
MPDRNKAVLGGTLIELPALRYTPAGIPVQHCVISHESSQQENGKLRQVIVEVEAVAVGPTGQAISRLTTGQQLKVRGFFAAAGQRQRRRLVLHINEFELLN